MSTRHDRRYLPVRTLALAGITVAALFGSLLWTPSGGRARRPATTADGAPTALAAMPPAAPRVAPTLVVPHHGRPAVDAPLDAAQTPAREIALASAVGELVTLLRGGLQASASPAELERCTGSNSPLCRQLLSDALQQVIATRALPSLTAGAIDVRSLQALGSAAVHAQLGRLMADSRDPIERVAALLALQGMPDLAPERLPPGAYRDLPEKPAIEAQLLLARHAELAFDDPELARATHDLAVSHGAQDDVRGSSLLALGHPQTANELTNAVRTLGESHDASWSGWRRSVAPAVGRCGFACVEAIEQIAFGEGARPEVVDDLMRSMTPDDRKQVRAYFAARVPAETAALLNHPLETTLPEG